MSSSSSGSMKKYNRTSVQNDDHVVTFFVPDYYILSFITLHEYLKILSILHQIEFCILFYMKTKICVILVMHHIMTQREIPKPMLSVRQKLQWKFACMTHSVFSFPAQNVSEHKSMYLQHNSNKIGENETWVRY